MFCTNCGKQLKDGVNFCPYCGQKQKADTIKTVSENISDAPEQEHLSEAIPELTSQAEPILNPVQEFKQIPESTPAFGSNQNSIPESVQIENDQVPQPPQTCAPLQQPAEQQGTSPSWESGSEQSQHQPQASEDYSPAQNLHRYFQNLPMNKKVCLLLVLCVTAVIVLCLVVSGSSGSNLVGTWTAHRGYDSETIVFKSDKTFWATDDYDTESGTWQLKNGKELILDFGQNSTVYVTIEDITSTSMVWKVGDGMGSTNILTLTKAS